MFLFARMKCCSHCHLIFLYVSSSLSLLQTFTTASSTNIIIYLKTNNLNHNFTESLKQPESIKKFEPFPYETESQDSFVSVLRGPMQGRQIQGAMEVGFPGTTGRRSSVGFWEDTFFLQPKWIRPSFDLEMILSLEHTFSDIGSIYGVDAHSSLYFQTSCDVTRNICSQYILHNMIHIKLCGTIHIYSL